MSVVFGLSIQTFDANSCTVWIENVLLKFSLGGEVKGVEGNSNRKVGLRVIAGMMKICSCLHVSNKPYPQNVS